MAKDRSLVRASDIGMWSFCQRAWWLARVQKTPHRQPAVLHRGQMAHEAHGRAVVQARRFRDLGFILISMAVLFAILTLLLWLMPG